MTTSLRPSPTFTPDPSALSPGRCPIALRHALAASAARLLERRPCPLDPEMAVRLAAVAKAPGAAS